MAAKNPFIISSAIVSKTMGMGSPTKMRTLF